MSLYFDLVLTCDLREELPQEYIDAIRHLTSHDDELKEKPGLYFAPDDFNIWDMFYDYHFLAPHPEQGDISCFRQIGRPSFEHGIVYHYSLQFSGRDIKDDFFHHHHLPFVHWLASVTVDGFIGYMKDTCEDSPTLLYVRNGKIEET